MPNSGRLCYYRVVRSSGRRAASRGAGVRRYLARPSIRQRYPGCSAAVGGDRQAGRSRCSRTRAEIGAARCPGPADTRARGEVGRQHADVLLMSTLAVYPGSFDPLTNGHVDIIERGARLFDRIIVAIAVNAEKAPMFSMAERVDIAKTVFRNHPNVEVDTFEGLLVNYVERRKANVIVRGLRAVSDFEYEFQMALMNRELAASIETVFMMPAVQYSYISSRLIKEVLSLGGKVHGLVPALVETRLREKPAIRTTLKR